MKYYTATVLSKGKKNDHGLYAETKKEAHYLAKIKFSGMILKVTEAAPPLEDQLKRFKENLLKNVQKKKINPDRMIAAIRQLAVMTNAGISVHDSFKEIANATDDPTLERVFNQIGEDINAGLSLSQSMNNFRF